MSQSTKKDILILKSNLSLEAKLTVFITLIITVIIIATALFNYWLQDLVIASLLTAAIIFPLSIIAIRSYMAPVNRILSALNDGFHNFLDNDFSVSLA